MLQEKIIFGIDGKLISHFASIEIEQTINEHNTFTIKVPQSVIENPMGISIAKSKVWNGKTVHVALAAQNDFLGIITNTFLQKIEDNVGNLIVIEGYSKTKILDSGATYASFEDKTLKDIVDTVLKTGAGERLQNLVNPEFTHAIPYQVQYKETDFDFLKRLAKQYAEWFFYDGEKLFFGKTPRQDQSKKLVFGTDIMTLDVGLQVLPNQFSGYTYNIDNNKLYQNQTEGEVEGLPSLAQSSIDAANELYTKPAFGPEEHTMLGMEALLGMTQKMRREAILANAHYVVGTSNNNTLRLGQQITIYAREIHDMPYMDARWEAGKTFYQENEIGIYIITELYHKATDIGEYQNSFRALPAFIKKLPQPQVKEPIAYAERAIVIDNADPKGYGRIRVKTEWQQINGGRSPWISPLTPDAGRSNAVARNRGFVAVPEVGDNVIIDHIGGDPLRPFVLGSFFNGTTGAGGGANNDFRSMTDPSGAKLEMERAKNIVLGDSNENKFHIDSVNNNVNINAIETLTINAKNVVINASENFTVNVGNTMTFNVVKNAFFNIFQKMQVNTPYLHQLVTGLFHTNASKALINSDNEIKLESPEMHLAGQKKLFMHSDEQAIINSKGTAEVHGTQGNKTSNVADAYETVKEEIIANCVVHFRPHTNWIGEFGFDWLRIGDTSHSGDVWYKNIVGEYEYSWNDINLQIYDSGSFEAKDWAYKKLKNEYGGVMTVPFLKNSYIVPYLSLYKDKTARLSLEMNIQAPPKKLEFKYDDTLFKLNHKDIAQKTKGKHTLSDFLEITCIKTFSDDKYIEVFADDQIVGKLRVHKNGKTDRKKINVVLAKVKTNVTGNGEEGKITAEHPKLERQLKQALITPHIVNENVDLTNDKTFTKKFVKTDALGNKSFGFKGKELHDYMLKNYNLKTKYPDSFIIYVFDILVPIPNSQILLGQAYDINSDNALVFKQKAASTLTHEFLHGLGLYHTFDNDGKFTFEKNKTDNIMDYSANRYATFVWQWQIIRNHKLVKPE
jgi:type VI secretion system secreted protein VgrG